MITSNIPRNLLNGYLYKARRIMAEPADAGYEQNDQDKLYLATVIQNFRSIGFIPDAKVFESMSHMDSDELTHLYLGNIDAIKVMVGADVDFNNVIYKNFPREVMEADDFKLYSNAIFYYCLTIGADVPHEQAVNVMDREAEAARFPFVEQNKMKVLAKGSAEDFLGQVKGIVESKITVTDVDKGIIDNFVKDHELFMSRDEAREFFSPLKCQNKENQCLLCASIMKHLEKDKDYSAELMSSQADTATDVLRLATYLSADTTSLNQNVKFKLSKNQSLSLLALLEKKAEKGDIAEDMFKSRYTEKWKRLSHIMHPQRNRKEYPLTARVFDDLYKGKKPETWARQYETAAMENDVKGMHDALIQRPGELIRHLEKYADTVFMSWSKRNEKEFWQAVEYAAGKAAIPVLVQELDHLKNPVRGVYLNSRDANGNHSVYVSNDMDAPKANYNDKAYVYQEMVKVLEKGIRHQLHGKEYIGKVYVAPEASRVCVPVHSLSEGNNSSTVYEPGSRLPRNNDKDEIRFSAWWTNAENGERTDVDLHAVFLDENFNKTGSVSFYNLKDENLKTCHSGDITDGGPYGGKGVSECIAVSNINREYLMGEGVHYIMAEPVIFSGNSFGVIPASFAVQERESDNGALMKGKIFEPSAVVYQQAITRHTRAYTPVVYDVKNNEFMVIDMPTIALNRNVSCITPLGETLCGPQVLKALIDSPKMTINDYVRIMQEAGVIQVVDDPRQADVMIGLNRPEEMADGQQFMLISNPTEFTSCWLDGQARPETILERTFETQLFAYENLSGYKEILDNDKKFSARYENEKAQIYEDPRYSEEQIAVIKKCFEDGLPLEQIKAEIADPRMNAREMEETRDEIVTARERNSRYHDMDLLCEEINREHSDKALSHHKEELGDNDKDIDNYIR